MPVYAFPKPINKSETDSHQYQIITSVVFDLAANIRRKQNRNNLPADNVYVGTHHQQTSVTAAERDWFDVVATFARCRRKSELGIMTVNKHYVGYMKSSIWNIRYITYYVSTQNVEIKFYKHVYYRLVFGKKWKFHFFTLFVHFE